MDRNTPYQFIEQDGKPANHESKWATIMWRGLNALMVIFFTMAAYVQINDADPYIWIPVYLVPAMLSTALVLKPSANTELPWIILCVTHIGVCIAGSLYLVLILIEIQAGLLQNPLQHEEGREFAGLLIIIFWLAVCHYASFGSLRSSEGQKVKMNSLLLLTVVLAFAPLLMWGLCFIEGMGKHLSHCNEMFPGMLG